MTRDEEERTRDAMQSSGYHFAGENVKSPMYYMQNIVPIPLQNSKVASKKKEHKTFGRVGDSGPGFKWFLIFPASVDEFPTNVDYPTTTVHLWCYAAHDFKWMNDDPANI
ncbi:unnamed protein product [Toxocara canis]|uniref:Uncharacterized protein n=1 Tax=Toxocara canis TaxID=6265 RepID=A0A183UJU7_TOXCA|nr:unnamed protein product [Toxocara canis]